MPDSVLQGIANLVAIGLERARAQDLAHQVEVARQSERLRTTLIDAMSHEFKTPLTSIKAATTSLLGDPSQPEAGRIELLTIADEEADRLRKLIDDTIEMARLDSAQADLHLEPSDLAGIVRETVASMRTAIEDRAVEIVSDQPLPPVLLDRRLVALAVKQLLDNALKYSPPGAPVTIRVHDSQAGAAIEVTDRGKGIPAPEQARVFDRFYRSPTVQDRIPGSGLGLSITHSIARAHRGTVTVESRPGQTTLRLTLPHDAKGEAA